MWANLTHCKKMEKEARFSHYLKRYMEKMAVETSWNAGDSQTEPEIEAQRNDEITVGSLWKAQEERGALGAHL